MGYIFKILLVTSALLFSSLSSATIISGNLATDGGKSVELSGLEWLSFDHAGLSTLGVSRSVISDPNSKWSLGGWRHASFSEMVALNSSFDFVRGNNINNEDGVSFLLGLWDSYTQPERTITVLERTLSDGTIVPKHQQVQSDFDRLYGATGVYDINGSLTGFGWAQYISAFDITKTFDDANLNTQTTSYSSWGIRENLSFEPDTRPERSSFGSYLVRESSPVPEPSIITLFGLGLVGIGFARRRRQS